MGLSVDEIGRLGAAAQKQIMQKLKATNAPKPRKFRNEPAMRGEIRFDSKREARRFDELKSLYDAGEIAELKLQPEFTLQEAFTAPDGSRVRAIRYRADFSYKTPAGGLIVEDVKGVRTDVYKLKRKMVRDKYGIEIVEV